MNLVTKQADARAVLRSAGWKDTDIFAVIPSYEAAYKESKWIRFDVFGTTGKTTLWKVVTKDGTEVLGEIRWFPRWRCYAFFSTVPCCVLEKQCLRDISDFCEEETNKHRAAAKVRSVPSATGTVSPD